MDQAVPPSRGKLNRAALLRELQTLLGAVLIVASLLKLQGKPNPLWQIHYPAFAATSLVILMAAAELILGSILIAGIYPLLLTRISIIVFSAFAMISLAKGLHGSTSCGCFGPVYVSPWYTTCFDVCAVLGLYLCKSLSPNEGRNLPQRFNSTRLLVAAGIFTFAVATAAVIAKKNSRIVSASPQAEGQPLDRHGGIVLLEPERWHDHEFPLFPEIDGSEPLRKGRWLVILYHHDCASCHDAIPAYQLLAQKRQASSDPQVAFVAMPPTATPEEDPVNPSSAYLHLKLRADHDWFVTAPLLAAIENGRVIDAFEGEQAIHPPRIPQWGQ